MPVTSTSGVAGVIQNPGAAPQANPMEGFVQQLAQAKQLEQQSAMQKLDAAMKLAEYDPATATKIGGPALDTLHKHAKGQAGGNTTDNLFMDIHRQAQAKQEAGIAESQQKLDTLKAQASEATAGAGASEADTAFKNAQTEHEAATFKAQQTIADPNSDPKAVAQSAGLLMASGKMTPEQFTEISTAEHLTPDQRDHMITATYDKWVGNPSEADYMKMAIDLTPSLMKDYDGDTSKATQAANLLVRGKSLPPELQPPMTDARIDKESKMASVGVSLGWPQVAINQAIAAGTADTKKLADKYGWTPAFTKQVESSLPQEERRTRAAESGAASERTRTEIQLREEAALTAERVAKSFKDIADAQKALNGKSPDMEKLLKQLQAVKGLETKPPNDPDLKAATGALKSQLLTSLVDEKGVPLLHEEDIPTWLGLAKNRQFVLGGPADPNATQGQGPAPSNPVGLPTSGVDSFLPPEVLGRIPGEILKTESGMLSPLMQGGAQSGMSAAPAVQDYIKRLVTAAQGK